MIVYVAAPDLPEIPTRESGFRYATDRRTNDIDNWLATDGPTSLADLHDLLTALYVSSRVGLYSVGTYREDRNGVPKEKRRISGPIRDLLIKPEVAKQLVARLRDIERRGSFRRKSIALRPSRRAHRENC